MCVCSAEWSCQRSKIELPNSENEAMLLSGLPHYGSSFLGNLFDKDRKRSILSASVLSAIHPSVSQPPAPAQPVPGRACRSRVVQATTRVVQKCKSRQKEYSRRQWSYFKQPLATFSSSWSPVSGTSDRHMASVIASGQQQLGLFGVLENTKLRGWKGKCLDPFNMVQRDYLFV